MQTYVMELERYVIEAQDHRFVRRGYQNNWRRRVAAQDRRGNRRTGHWVFLLRRAGILLPEYTASRGSFGLTAIQNCVACPKAWQQF